MTLEGLKEKQKAGCKIAIYCCGQIGRALYQMLQICGIQADCFLDNDEKNKNRMIADKTICKDPDAVMNKDDYIIFIAIHVSLYDVIRETAVKQGFTHFESYSDLFDDIIRNHAGHYRNVLFWFSTYPLVDMLYARKPNQNTNAMMAPRLDLRQNKVAVYTSVFGNYDRISLTKCDSLNADYYIVSDECPEQLNGYIWINAKDYVPVDVKSPVKRNRYVKMHPHKLFAQYQYSVYIDGNIEICGDITECIRDTRSGIAAYVHPLRDCIFYEATTVVSHKRADVADTYQQITQYLTEGMPLHYGLFEMGVLGREHHNPLCKALMEKWWQEFDKGAQRDQISFMYVLWKNHLGIRDIASLGEDIRLSHIVKLRKHIASACVYGKEK